jgi:hypothetical protein
LLFGVASLCFPACCVCVRPLLFGVASLCFPAWCSFALFVCGIC